MTAKARCPMSEPSKCPRWGTEGCLATQVERTGGTIAPLAFDLLMKADIACSLRALVEQGHKPLSVSKTFSPQMPAEPDAQPVTVEFS